MTIGFHPGGGGTWGLTYIFWLLVWKMSGNYTVGLAAQHPIELERHKVWYLDTIDPIAVENTEPAGIVAENLKGKFCPW